MANHEAWCPWCRRWIFPVSHIGPGSFCPACQGHLGTDSAAVHARKPGQNSHIPIHDESPQPELAIA
jgi:hypothetical protein